MTVGELLHQLGGANRNYTLIVRDSVRDSVTDNLVTISHVVIDHGGSEVYVHLGEIVE